MWTALWVGAAVWAQSTPFVEAERLHYSGGRLQVEQGKLLESEYSIRFSRGEIDADSGQMSLHDVEMKTANGWFLRAARLEKGEDGIALLHDASLTACDCDCPVWAVSAETLQVINAESAGLSGAKISVLGRLALPVPDVRVPLKRRLLGAGLPSLRWDMGDYRIEQPLFVRIKPQLEFEIRPGWWRGPLLAGQWMSGPETMASWIVEWSDSFAALGHLEHSHAGNGWGTAASGLVVDRFESLQRAPGFLDRQRPFLEQQARAWYGHFHVGAGSWQGDDKGSYLHASWIEPVWSRGPVSGHYGLQSGVLDGHWRTELWSGLNWVEARGPFEWTLQGRSRALDYEMNAQALDVEVRGDVGLVFHSRQDALLHELKLGLRAQAGERLNRGLLALHPLDQAPSVLLWGPALEALWWGRGHVRLDAWPQFTMEGFSGWETSALWKHENRELTAESRWNTDDALHGLAVHQTGDSVDLGVGFYGYRLTPDASVRTGLGLSGRFGIPVAAGFVWPQASLLMSDESVDFVGGGLGLESNCECFVLGFQTAWTRDRDELTVGVNLELLPRLTSKTNVPQSSLLSPPVVW